MHQKGIRRTGFLIITLILLLLILKQSFYLRSIGYDQIPETFVILDERTNVWHGLSIRQTGVPSAWSNLNVYMKGFGGEVDGLNVKIDGKNPNLTNFYTFPKPGVAITEYDFGRGLRHLRFVQPYLDHPPIGALILSGLVSQNVKTFSDLLPADFRRTSLWLGTATGVMIFLLGWQISRNPFIGLLSAAIYGSVPTYSLLSRYALLENVLNPLMLITLNLLIFAKSIIEKHVGQKASLVNGILIAAGIFSGLTALTKIIGWFMLVVGVLLLYYWRIDRKRILFFVIPATVVGLLYFAWGLYLDPKLFADIIFYQGMDRGFVGSLNFLTTLGGISIANFPFDGWWIGGFLALLMLVYKKEYVPIIFSALVYLVMALFLGGANYPWYYIPLIPLMSIATALLFWRIATQPSFLLIMIFFLVYFSSSFYWGYGVFQADKLSTNYMQPYQMYRLMLIVFLSAGLGSLFYSRFKFKSLYLKIWFIFMLVVVYQLWKWNGQSILFILSHWGRFPALYTPGTF